MIRREPSLWRRWGLRCNPFGEVPPSDLPGLVVAEIDELYAWWTESERRALQWIGPCGHGKSAHLFALQGREPALVRVYLPEGGPLPRLPETNELLLDEAQRLPRRRRGLLFRRCRRLALATHRDMRPELERAGWQVRTLEVGDLDPGKLARILERRLLWAGARASSVAQATALEAAGLVASYGGHLRALFDDLYEVFQHPSIANPWRQEHDGQM